jgi:hypothetical protein
MTPYAVISFHAKATCVFRLGSSRFLSMRAVAILWAQENYDNKWHRVASAAGPPLCFPYGSDVTLCTMTPGGLSPVYPPYGHYHTQLIVFGEVTNYTAPATVFVKIAELNSEEYCHQGHPMPEPSPWVTQEMIPNCWPPGNM